MNNNSSNFLLKKYQEWKIDAPLAHIVLGSGIASAFEHIKSRSEWKEVATLPFSEIPDFVPTTAPGHKGSYKYFQYKKEHCICFQTGRLHGYEGLSAREVVKTVLTPFECGTRKFILTNAAGSLKTHMHAGSVMMIEDHFNMTGRNPLVGKNPQDSQGKDWGPRFPDMSQIYSPEVNNNLEEYLKVEGLDCHHGNYIGVLGPSFETPAETKLYSQWGFGAVGMSTVWEAIALKHRGAQIAGFSLLANMAAGIGEKAGVQLTEEEVLEEGQKAAQKILNALFDFGENL